MHFRPPLVVHQIHRRISYVKRKVFQINLSHQIHRDRIAVDEFVFVFLLVPIDAILSLQDALRVEFHDRPDGETIAILYVVGI